jgi:protein tyrosine phosphatase
MQKIRHRCWYIAGNTYDYIHVFIYVIFLSAGVGRTGAFIAIDILAQQLLKATQNTIINIYQCVYLLRKQRIRMVQTLVSIFVIDSMLKYFPHLGAIRTCL